mgnify:FL=1|tara:strand:- start:123 stop:371 length:249 start_codon:yes stop_codon:yes gene_type:complete
MNHDISVKEIIDANPALAGPEGWLFGQVKEKVSFSQPAVWEWNPAWIRHNGDCAHALPINSKGDYSALYEIVDPKRVRINSK